MSSAAAAQSEDEPTLAPSASASATGGADRAAATLAPPRPTARATADAGRSGSVKAKRGVAAADRTTRGPAPRRPPRPPSRPRAPFVLLVVGVLTAGLVTLLLLNTATAKGSFHQRALTQQQQELVLKAQQLQREVNAKSAPEALRQAAEKLGMVPGGDPVFLVVGPDGVPTIIGTPAQVTSPPPAPDYAKAQAAKLAQEKTAASQSAASQSAAIRAKASQSAANESKAGQASGSGAPATTASGAATHPSATAGPTSALPSGQPSGAQGGTR